MNQFPIRWRAFWQMALVCALMICGLPVRAVGPAEEPDPDAELGSGLGRHFILLIDDSGDMRSFADAVLEGVPDLLFGEGQGRRVRWPPFVPGRDVLSVFFFTIHEDGEGGDCKASGGSFSSLPAAIFERASFSVEETGHLGGFQQALGERLAMPCRWGGKLSPIISAQTAALPFSVPYLDPASRFSSTILVVATNDFYSTSVSPAVELGNLRRSEVGQSLRDVPAAESALAKILPKFRFEVPEGWSREVRTTGRPLHLRALRIQPVAPTPEALAGFSPKVELDRIAISRDRIVWRAARQGEGELRLAVAEGLEPTRLTWRLHDGQGGAWKLESTEVPPVPHSLELSQCGAACSRQGNALVVSLAPLLDLAAMSPSDPVPQTPGVLDFEVEFHFDSGGIYDFLYPTTSRQRIELRLAPMLEMPGTKLEAAVPVSNEVLSDLWRVSDGEAGLTQALALERLYARRDLTRLLLTLLALALGAAVVFILFRTAYHRPFEPELDWQSAGPIVIDLSKPGGSRLLVGTVGIKNRGEQPFFGRLLRHDEQPARESVLALEKVDFEAAGFQLGAPADAVCGFLGSEGGPAGENEEKGNDAVVPAVQRTVSHGQRLPVFLATEAFADFGVRGREVEETTVVLGSTARLQEVRTDNSPGVETLTQFELRVLPEPPTPPRIHFTPGAGRLEFSKGRDILVGHFTFLSQAGHFFAFPFESEYELEGQRDGAQLASRPFRLEPSKVRVASGQELKVPVMLHCDGELVRNPESKQQTYTLQLRGLCHPDSQRGPHEVQLHRDSTRAEAEIEVQYLNQVFDLHRGSDGVVVLRDSRGGKTLRAENGMIQLEEDFQFVIAPGAGPALTLASIVVGNSGRSGRGRVRVEIERKIDIAAEIAGRLHLNGKMPADNLVHCSQEHQRVPFEDGRLKIEVGEGEASQKMNFQLDGGPVRKIDGARLPADQVQAILKLSVHVKDDLGKVQEWKVDLAARLAMEKLPSLNWLCIDFGTSAIAAAVGRADGNMVHSLDLQRTEMVPGQSLATVDHLNTETDTPFIPSWVVCDGDLRRSNGSEAEISWPAGFPLHFSKSDWLREASFVGLPALSPHLSSRPGRIVFSLKQWLARLSPSVRLGDAVTFRTTQGEEKSRLVPLNDLLEAAFSAFVNCYLPPHQRMGADQVVLTHPNTFTPRHRERYHGIASRVLMRHGIVEAPEHVTLLSESDAVAYAYCIDRMNEQNHPKGTERIVVYDFGAGTLDLSLIKVEWRADRKQPRSWMVEGRVGLPLAGNHLDELLMRLIDEQLRRPELLAGTGTEYLYPVVGRRATANPEEHRDAVLKTWTALRRAKHQWKRDKPFRVDVGEENGRGGVLVRQGVLNLLAEAPHGEAALLLEGKRIVLSIPAEAIANHHSIRSFLDFVTQVAIAELLAQAGAFPEVIDTLLISGRGALWPGFDERLKALLPHVTNVISEKEASTRKDVVSKGAIALQALRELHLEIAESARPQLGILLGGRHLIGESEFAGGRAVDLSGCEEFRLVQMGVQNPEPTKHLKSLHRHFYIDLADGPIRRQVLWREDPRLFVEIQEQGAYLEIVLKNNTGQSIAVSGYRSPGAHPGEPWPTTSFLLEPEP